MTRKTRRTRTKIFLATLASAGLLGGGLAGGIALADHQPGHNNFAGGGTVAHRVATSTDIFVTTSANSWQTLPGSSLSYTVPSGTVRLVTAGYTAESWAYDGTGGCAVRIVTRKSGSTTLSELYPRAGGDFMWEDTAGGLEGRAMSRSIRVASGTRYFSVQVLASTPDMLRCRLDDWHFQINVHTAS